MERLKGEARLYAALEGGRARNIPSLANNILLARRIPLFAESLVFWGLQRDKIDYRLFTNLAATPFTMGRFRIDSQLTVPKGLSLTHNSAYRALLKI